jgi:hypothetical protein
VGPAVGAAVGRVGAAVGAPVGGVGASVDRGMHCKWTNVLIDSTLGDSGLWLAHVAGSSPAEQAATATYPGAQLATELFPATAVSPDGEVSPVTESVPHGEIGRSGRFIWLQAATARYSRPLAPRQPSTEGTSGKSRAVHSPDIPNPVGQ